MKTGRLSLLAFFCLLSSMALGQSAEDYFNRAANEYIFKDDKIALNTIDSGLSRFPGDRSLTNLREKILKEKQQQEQQDQQQDQQDQKEEEQQDQQQQQDQQDEQSSEDNKDADKKDQSDEAQQEDTEEKGDEMEAPPVSREEKLKDLNLTEEKALMILDAMKNNEIQYIQQNKRKPTKKPDSGKPDW